MAGLETVALSFFLRVEDNQVLCPDFSSPVAVGAVVLLVYQLPLVPLRTGDVARVDLVLAVDAP